MNKDIYEELESFNSSLAGMNNNHIFEPPEGYFDKMQSQVLQKLQSSDTKERKTRILTKYKIAIAASILLILALTGLIYLNKANSEATDQITDNAVLMYIQDDIENLDIEDISLFLDDDNIDIVKENLRQDEIEYYFEKNIDEIQVELLYN